LELPTWFSENNDDRRESEKRKEEKEGTEGRKGKERIMVRSVTEHFFKVVEYACIQSQIQSPNVLLPSSSSFF
jgi:hypothetical protein